MECFCLKLIIDGQNIFSIWHTDGFVCKNHRILTFADENAAMHHAENHGIQLICQGDTVNCDITDLNDCNAIADLWNTASDAASSADLHFSGDDNEYSELYAKIVSGCNLPALEHDDFQPKWTVHETGMLRNILTSAETVLKTAVSPLPLRIYALAAVNSGYITADRLRELAFSRIERTISPEAWVIDLAAADNDNEITAVLAEAWNSDTYSHDEYRCSMMGHYYLRYKENRLSLTDFLRICGDYSDAYGITDCEDFYAPLTELEKNPSLEYDADFIGSIDRLCSEWAEIAFGQIKLLTEYMEVWE